VWHYKINRETRDMSPRLQHNPWLSVLAVTLGALLIIPAYVSFFRTGSRIAEAQRAAGLTPTCNGWIGILLTLVLGLHPLYYQMEMNKIVDHFPGAAEGQAVPVIA